MNKIRAIRVALQQRLQRFDFRVKRRSRKDELLRFLERDVWPRVPAEQRGRRLSREEENLILGYGPEGA